MITGLTRALLRTVKKFQFTEENRAMNMSCDVLQKEFQLINGLDAQEVELVTPLAKEDHKYA